MKCLLSLLLVSCGTLNLSLMAYPFSNLPTYKRHLIEVAVFIVFCESFDREYYSYGLLQPVQARHPLQTYRAPFHHHMLLYHGGKRCSLSPVSSLSVSLCLSLSLSLCFSLPLYVDVLVRSLLGLDLPASSWRSKGRQVFSQFSQ
jgi:hypothetical protein